MSRIVPIREPIKNREVVHDDKARRDWASTRPFCYFCGQNYGVESHHICGASGRSDEPCNLIRACGPCHRRIHGTEKPKICLAEVLLTKLSKDPKEFDFDRIEQLFGFCLLLRKALP